MIPNAGRLTNGKFHQLSADGKSGLVLVEKIPGLAIHALPFGELPTDFQPIKGIYKFLIILKYPSYLIPLFHWSRQMTTF